MGWSENVETPLRRVVHEWFTFSHFRLPGVRNYYRRLGYTLCRLDPGEVFHSLKDFGKGPLKIGKLVYDWRFPKEDPPTHGFQYHHFDIKPPHIRPSWWLYIQLDGFIDILIAEGPFLHCNLLFLDHVGIFPRIYGSTIPPQQ